MGPLTIPGKGQGIHVRTLKFNDESKKVKIPQIKTGALNWDEIWNTKSAFLDSIHLPKGEVEILNALQTGNRQFSWSELGQRISEPLFWVVNGVETQHLIIEDLSIRKRGILDIQLSKGEIFGLQTDTSTIDLDRFSVEGSIRYQKGNTRVSVANLSYSYPDQALEVDQLVLNDRQIAVDIPEIDASQFDFFAITEDNKLWTSSITIPTYTIRLVSGPEQNKKSVTVSEVHRQIPEQLTQWFTALQCEQLKAENGRILIQNEDEISENTIQHILSDVDFTHIQPDHARQL